MGRTCALVGIISCLDLLRELPITMPARNRLQQIQISEWSSGFVQKGVMIAYENAVSLIEDARLLSINERYPRSFAIAMLASEELGKSMSLCHLLNALVWNEKDDVIKAEKVVLQSFRNHSKKAFWSTTLDMAAESIPENSSREEHINSVVDELSEVENGRLNELRELSMYVDFKDGEFSTPEFSISKQQTQHFLDKVIQRLKNFESVDLRMALEPITKQIELAGRLKSR